MSTYSYKTILSKAIQCHTSVKKEYKLGITPKWSYYIAKSILTPKKDIKRIGVNDAPKPAGDYISRQIPEKGYKTICKNLISFVEGNKTHRLPNYCTYGNLKIDIKLVTALLSFVLYKYDRDKKYPAKQNLTSKIFIKPTEYENEVYAYFVQKTGKKPKTVDETLTYVSNNMIYEGYSDDKYSNKQVMDKKKGNCTDLLQWLINMAKAEGYETKCIHVQCRTSGIGHVFGKFKHKKHTGGKWITRDPAAVAGGHDIRKVWCENGYLLDTDPSWFRANLNR